jgi:hypothetical protein
MESAKQEKYNLMHDNPVAKHASGGSWMSKHSNSAFQMGHSPAKMGHDSPAKNTETPAERKARLRRENQAELARLKEVKAKREARNAADAKKPKPEPQTMLQALKQRIISDLTGKTGKGGPGSSRN